MSSLQFKAFSRILSIRDLINLGFCNRSPVFPINTQNSPPNIKHRAPEIFWTEWAYLHAVKIFITYSLTEIRDPESAYVWLLVQRWCRAHGFFKCDTYQSTRKSPSPQDCSTWLTFFPLPHEFFIKVLWLSVRALFSVSQSNIVDGIECGESAKT